MINFLKILILCALLSGCTFAYGPTLQNHLPYRLDLKIVFDDGSISFIEWDNCQIIHAGGFGGTKSPNKKVININIYFNGDSVIQLDAHEVDDMINHLDHHSGKKVWIITESGIELSDRGLCS